MERFRQRNILVFVMALAISVLVASHAGADSKTYKNYGRIGIGVNQPTQDLDDLGYDAGVNAQVAVGRYLTKHLIIEGAIAYFYSDQEFSGSTVTAGTYERDDYLGVSALLLTLKGELPLGPVKLFAGAGVGGYFVSLHSDIDTQNIGNFDANEYDETFGGHVVVGGSYDITPRVFVGIEGLYRWTDEIDMRETVGTVPVTLKANLDGFTVTFSGGFRF